MRIAVDGRGLVGNVTGAGYVLGWLLDRLRLDAPEHDYVLVTPAAARWRLRRHLWWEQVEFPRQAARIGADVLHVPGGTATPLLRHRRTVVTLHDLALTAHPEWLPRGRGRWYWARWVPWTARFARCVLVGSRAALGDAVSLGGIDAARVRITPWGVPPDMADGPARGAADVARRRHELPARFVLYVGTIDRRKDVGTLLHALARLDASVSLVVAGTLIAGRTDFDADVDRLGLRSRVRVLGYVPRGDLPGIYAAATAFVYPSLWEGFGLPVLEAMACGVPAVTYNVSSLPEVAGDAAVLLDPPVSADRLAAALTRVVDDGALRADLIARGRARAREFDWRDTARATLAAYAGIAA